MELLNVTESCFITGTDTEIGKTIASVALLQATQKQGWITVGYKPVASGGRITSVGLRNDDVLILQRNSTLSLPYTSVNCYTFFEPVSPHIASKNEGQLIKFDQLTKGLRKLEILAEWVFIEGAGGWFTPLTMTQTFSDWVIQEQLSVILVVGLKVGCINHAMLTAKAISQANLHLVGWIANNIIAFDKWRGEYLLTLKRVLNAPFLGEIPWLSKKTEELEIGKYLNLSTL